MSLFKKNITLSGVAEGGVQIGLPSLLHGEDTLSVRFKVLYKRIVKVSMWQYVRHKCGLLGGQHASTHPQVLPAVEQDVKDAFESISELPVQHRKFFETVESTVKGITDLCRPSPLIKLDGIEVLGIIPPQKFVEIWAEQTLQHLLRQKK